jgi:hypothetical protein
LALTSILRVADGLDYHHDSVVKGVECAESDDEVVLKLSSRTDHEAEVEAAAKKADLFERTFRRKVRFE